MQTEPITIQVPPALAEAYRSAPPERQRKMELYMALRLRDFEATPAVPFNQAWTELAEEAKANGITEEAIEALLREDDEQTRPSGDGYRGRA